MQNLGSLILMGLSMFIKDFWFIENKVHSQSKPDNVDHFTSEFLVSLQIASNLIKNEFDLQLLEILNNIQKLIKTVFFFIMIGFE
jgi:hypothetical protein